MCTIIDIEVLNKWVTEGVASYPHDFNASRGTNIQFYRMEMNFNKATTNHRSIRF